MTSENLQDNDLQFTNNSDDLPFSASPPSLKFIYSKSTFKDWKNLRLTNESSGLRRLFILPPLTRYFKIIFPEQGWIAPGLSVCLKVSFEPNKLENLRHYKDCIRVVCEKGENRLEKDLFVNKKMTSLNECILSIPIVAEPFNPHCKLPDEIDFGCVQPWQTANAEIKIDPLPGEKTVFFIAIPKENTNFIIFPLHGVLNEDDPPQRIHLTYIPIAYKTTRLPIQVCIPNSSMTPYTVFLVGSCKPWPTNRLKENFSKDELIINREQFQKTEQKHEKENLETMEVASSESSSESHPTKKTVSKKSTEIPLNTVHGVIKFLLQKPVKEKDPYFDLIGPLGKYQEDEKVIYDELEKEFLLKVQQEKEWLQHISFSTEISLGPSPTKLNIEELAEIEVERFNTQQSYRKSLNIVETENLYTNTSPLYFQRRILRRFDEFSSGPRFRFEPQDTSFLKYEVLSIFIQAARKVIIRNRLIKILEALKRIYLGK